MTRKSRNAIDRHTSDATGHSMNIPRSLLLLILQAKGTTSSLRLRNEDGREQTLSP